MKLNTILYEKEDNIAVITLNRPASMNAINEEFMRELEQILGIIESDDRIGAVILTGGEKAFAAGADIKYVIDISTPLEAHDFSIRIQTLFTRLENLERPTIAAIGGLALGGGCELALACDIRIAAENASFGLPEIKLGIIPGAGGTQKLPRLVGIGRGKELLYTGDVIDANEAYRIGLANKVVRLDSLMDEAKKMAMKLAQRPAIALKMLKVSVNKGMSMDLQSALAHEVRCFEILFSTEDQKEGMKAFVEKRKPVFKNR
jgi:enoyl-CoA hydratase